MFNSSGFDKIIEYFSAHYINSIYFKFMTLQYKE